MHFLNALICVSSLYFSVFTMQQPSLLTQAVIMRKFVVWTQLYLGILTAIKKLLETRWWEEQGHGGFLSINQDLECSKLQFTFQGQRALLLSHYTAEHFWDHTINMCLLQKKRSLYAHKTYSDLKKKHSISPNAVMMKCPLFEPEEGTVWSGSCEGAGWHSPDTNHGEESCCLGLLLLLYKLTRCADFASFKESSNEERLHFFTSKYYSAFSVVSQKSLQICVLHIAMIIIIVNWAFGLTTNNSNSCSLSMGSVSNKASDSSKEGYIDVVFIGRLYQHSLPGKLLTYLKLLSMCCIGVLYWFARFEF